MGGVLGVEPIAPRGVPPVQLVHPIGDNGIVRVLKPASRGDLCGACQRPGKSEYLHPRSLQLEDFELEAARGTRRPSVKAESQKWVNSDKAAKTNNTQEPGHRQPEAVASLQSFKEDEPRKRFPLGRARCGVGTQQRGRHLGVQSLVKSEFQRPARGQMLRRIHPTVQLPQLEKLSSCNQSTESCSAPLRRLTMTRATSSTRRCGQKSNS